MYERGSKEYNRVVSQSMEVVLSAWQRLDSTDYHYSDGVIAFAVYSLRRFHADEMAWVAAWMEGIRVASGIIAEHQRLTRILRRADRRSWSEDTYVRYVMSSAP